MVFAPAYHIRGTIWLADAKGLPLPPAVDAAAEEAGSSSDAFVLAARRKLRLTSGGLSFHWS